MGFHPAMTTLEIKTTCSPGYDLPAMQNITLEGVGEKGQQLCKLEALRWAEFGFCMDNPAQLVDAFDCYSALAFGLAEEVHRRRRSLAARYYRYGDISCGFIGIMTIETSPEARGHRYGLKLLRHLKKIHAGMPWYAGLQAAPYRFEADTREFTAMRRRLVAYYSSDQGLGFKQDSPRRSPSLMTTFWDCD
jgi:hypothetical protein